MGIWNIYTKPPKYHTDPTPEMIKEETELFDKHYELLEKMPFYNP